MEVINRGNDDPSLPACCSIGHNQLISAPRGRHLWAAETPRSAAPIDWANPEYQEHGTLHAHLGSALRGVVGLGNQSRAENPGARRRNTNRGPPGPRRPTQRYLEPSSDAKRKLVDLI
jgi:hypothetical protein